MIKLFSSTGLKLLESVCFTPTLFAFDFDGTLSKIVKQPEHAKLNSSTGILLSKLGKYAPLAIISGRSLSDLMPKIEKVQFRKSQVHMVGNHGLEGIHTGKSHLKYFDDTCNLWKSQLQVVFEKDNSYLNGAIIEDKNFSIAVHYRNCRSKKNAKSKILETVSNLSPPPRLIMGKSVVNVIPSGAPHKGIALLELMVKTKMNSAFYIGDDDTDEDVFSLTDPRIFTVRIGHRKNSQAKFYIESQSEINTLLKKMISFISEEKFKL